MALTCAGRPGVTCNKTSDLEVNPDDNCHYCKACWRALRANNRGAARCETSGGDSQNQDDSDVTPLPVQSPTDVIFDPLLSYMSSSLASGTCDMVKSAVLDRFSAAQINRARDALWQGADTAVIGPLVTRNSTTRRPAKVAYVADIFDAFQKLDRVEKVPAIAILSTDLHTIPRCHPEEVLSISAMDRMNRLEQRITFFTDILDKVEADNALLRDQFDTFRRDTDADDCSDTDSPSLQKKSKKKNKKKKSGHQIPGIPGAATLTGLPGGSVSSHQVDALLGARLDGNGGTDRDDFTRVESSREKQQRRKQKQQQLVVGTGTVINSFKGVDPNRHLFVYGVSADATTKDLEEFVEEQHNIHLNHIEIVPPSTKRMPGSTSQSFHITVSVENHDLLSKPESWPSGVKVRRFFPARATPSGKTGSES